MAFLSADSSCLFHGVTAGFGKGAELRGPDELPGSVEDRVSGPPPQRTEAAFPSVLRAFRRNRNLLLTFTNWRFHTSIWISGSGWQFGCAGNLVSSRPHRAMGQSWPLASQVAQTLPGSTAPSPVPVPRPRQASGCCAHVQSAGGCRGRLGSCLGLPCLSSPRGQLGFVTSDNWAKKCRPRCSEVACFTLSTGTVFFQPRHSRAPENTTS